MKSRGRGRSRKADDPQQAWSEVSEGVSDLSRKVRGLLDDPEFRDGVQRVKGGMGEAVSATLGNLGLGPFVRGFGRRGDQDSGDGADVVSIDEEIRQQRRRRPQDAGE